MSVFSLRFKVFRENRIFSEDAVLKALPVVQMRPTSGEVRLRSDPERPKSVPRAAKSDARVAQERPKSTQERP